MTATSSDSSKKRTKAEKPRVAETAHGRLIEELRQQEGISDDLATFISENWARFLGTIAVCLIVVALYFKYQTLAQERLGRASRQLSKIQAELNKPPKVEKNENKGKDTKKNSEDAKENDKKPKVNIANDLKTLKSQYSDTVYGKLASLYQARLSLTNKEFEAARKHLQEFEPQKLESPREGSGLDPERALDEMAALLYAKSLVAEPARQNEGKKLLRKLALNSQLVAAEAIVALLRLSSTGEQRDNASELARTVMTSTPTVSDIIRQELTRMGISPKG